MRSIVSALGVCSGKLLVNFSLLSSSFPFLTSACLTLLLGPTVKSFSQSPAKSWSKRVHLTARVFLAEPPSRFPEAQDSLS